MDKLKETQRERGNHPLPASREKKPLYRYAGIFMMATGVIHTIVGVIIAAIKMPEMLANGIFDEAVPGLSFEAEGVLWFFMFGFFMFVLGMCMHSYIHTCGKPVPRAIGWVLTAITVILLVLVPVSGAWLLIPQVLILLLAPGYRKAQQANAE